MFILDVDFLWRWQEFTYSGPIGVFPVVSLVFLVHAHLVPGLVSDWGMVQSLVFEVGVPVADCDLVLVEEGKVQHGWPAVIDWVRSECVGDVGQAKICCIADVD